MNRRRLEIEAWRDALLALSGNLDRTVGGPSAPLSSPDNVRRTFYGSISRHDLDSLLRLFDFPDPNVTSDQRTVTTVPLQQLFVLNGEFMIRQAKAFARRFVEFSNEADASRIKRAFLLAYGRPPTSDELQLGVGFLTQPDSGSQARTNPPQDGSSQPNGSENTLSRWEQYAQVLLSANEFMYVD
jgi:hypothetical protein